MSNGPWTFFVQDESGQGTTWIEAVTADTLDAATDAALTLCADAWDCAVGDLRVLGIAVGEVQIIEWNDLDD